MEKVERLIESWYHRRPWVRWSTQFYEKKNLPPNMWLGQSRKKKLLWPVATQRFLEFSPRNLGRWSNLTSIFFKWVESSTERWANDASHGWWWAQGLTVYSFIYRKLAANKSDDLINCTCFLFLVYPVVLWGTTYFWSSEIFFHPQVHRSSMQARVDHWSVYKNPGQQGFLAP